MKDKFIESAKIIIEQGGNCRLSSPSCCNCILNEGDCSEHMSPSIRLDWFKNWLKENEKSLAVICSTCNNYCKEYTVYPEKFDCNEWIKIEKKYIYQCPRCGWTDFLDNIPKEEEMKKQKIMFENEEQFIEFLKDINGGSYSTTQIINAKNIGYIKKSELETLVEECEEILLHNTTQNTEYITIEKQEKILMACQDLKKENEKLKSQKQN